MSNTNAHKPGYKYTPIGWIPENWKVQGIKDIADVGTGKKDTQNKIDNGLYPFFVRSQTIERIDSYSFDGEAVLTAGDGVGVGKVFHYINGKFDYHQRVYKISDFKNLNGRFFYEYFSHNFQREVTKYNAKGSVDSVRLEMIAGRLVRIAPSLEQEIIAHIFRIWHDVIQMTKQLIKQLKQRNKGLSQQLLKPKSNWNDCKLSDIFERVTRKNTELNTNVVTISAQRGFVRQDDFFNKQVASEVLDNYFLVEKGEFCYNKSYSNGYPWGATKRLNDFEKAVVTTLYICFRLRDKTKHSGSYFEYYFESGLLDVGLSKIAHEGGRAHGLLNVTPHDFFSLKISVPDITEQNRIYNILTTANNELNLYQQQLTNLQQQKKGLMQKLLSGEVKVKM